MTASAALRVQHLVKRYDGSTARAVDDVSFDVAAGEFVTLLGPSGCGKSTLLNLIAGFVTPDAGEILVGGQPITQQPPHLRDIGVVFQNYALFPHMSVADNVGFGLKMRGVTGREAAQRVQQALETVQLAELAARKPRALSGGQQQRIALARALVIRPRLILLDEPFSAIDKNLRADMQVELKRIQRDSGVTMLFVTHDQAEALSLSDRIAVMAQGAVQQFAAPAELYRQPANPFVASFIGEVNRLPCAVHTEGDQIVLQAEPLQLRLPRSRAHFADATPQGTAPAGTHLYLRPDALTAHDLDDLQGAPANLGAGTVEAHVYQGTHTDMIVRSDSGWALRVRHLGHEALTRWPQGQRLKLNANLAEAHVFIG